MLNKTDRPVPPRCEHQSRGLIWDRDRDWELDSGRGREEREDLFVFNDTIEGPREYLNPKP